MTKKTSLLNNIVIIICTFVFWFFLVTSPLVSMILWEGLKKILCYIPALWWYCYQYADSILDISEKDLFIFIIPTWILFVTFCIYFLNALNEAKADKKNIAEKKKNYFLIFLIILWILPAAWVFVTLMFL